MPVGLLQLQLITECECDIKMFITYDISALDLRSPQGRRSHLSELFSENED